MVKPATALGRSGLHDWFIQRVSAIVIAVYVLYLFGYFVGASAAGGVSYDSWRNLFDGTAFKIFSLLTIIALMAHAWIGMWTIFTDYIKPVALRFVAQALLIITSLTVLVWGVTILWGV